jgi:hypothetical protein
MPSSNGVPGPARVAVSRNEALVLWVDRQPHGSRAMFFMKLFHDGRVTQPMVLSPLENPGDEPVAPSAVALPDGGYLISWVQRHAASAERSAWVQRYDRAMRRMGQALEIARGSAVRTARIAYDPVQGFTVAYAVESGVVYAVRGRCR